MCFVIICGTWYLAYGKEAQTAIADDLMGGWVGGWITCGWLPCTHSAHGYTTCSDGITTTLYPVYIPSDVYLTYPIGSALIVAGRSEL